MKIQQAQFVQSNSDWKKCPPPMKPEYAFIGRSNVGKSSLINRLAQKNGLAKTSQTPGKTQLINHFLVNDAWYLVDLPGYGYAKVSKTEREKFDRMIHGYLQNRENLLVTFVLIDVRHPPQQADLQFMATLSERQIPFYLVFTKADKLSNAQVEKNVNYYRDGMLQFWTEMPKYFVTSSVDGRGRDEILDAIDALNAEFVMPARR
jgi:GTP-binding protein